MVITSKEHKVAHLPVAGGAVESVSRHGMSQHAHRVTLTTVSQRCLRVVVQSHLLAVTAIYDHTHLQQDQGINKDYWICTF